MANLSPKEIRKYTWRSEVFIKKLKDKEPFEVTGGKKVVLVESKQAMKVLASGSDNELKALRFSDGNGNDFKLTDFVKNADFGGKGERSGVAKEDAALKSLNDALDSAKKAEGLSYVNVRIGNKTYKVSHAESTPGTPKSDFHLVDPSGKEIVWISHKDGKTEKDFQQWGGVSQRAEPDIFKHKETQAFAKLMVGMFPKGIPNATTVARKIKDKKLKMMSIYGNQYGKPFSQQNVTLAIQGPISLKKVGQSYKIESNHVHLNGEDLTGGYEAVFMAIYKGDRSDLGIKGARVVISPMGCRKIHQWV